MHQLRFFLAVAKLFLGRKARYARLARLRLTDMYNVLFLLKNICSCIFLYIPTVVKEIVEKIQTLPGWVTGVVWTLVTPWSLAEYRFR